MKSSGNSPEFPVSRFIALATVISPTELTLQGVPRRWRRRVRASAPVRANDKARDTLTESNRLLNLSRSFRGISPQSPTQRWPTGQARSTQDPIMNKAQLKKFKALLEEKRDEIVKKAKQTLDEDMTLDANDLPDEMDLARASTCSRSRSGCAVARSRSSTRSRRPSPRSRTAPSAPARSAAKRSRSSASKRARRRRSASAAKKTKSAWRRTTAERCAGSLRGASVRSSQT